MKYISFFKDINRSMVSEFGGKTASLGDMAQAKLPIPDGFGINVEAFKDFADSKVSQEFEDELMTAFDKLGAKKVAVRSSAVAEDAGDASWAGQLETYLNVSKETLIDNVRKCWLSMNSERALAYASDKDVRDEDRLVGVTVQSMVESEMAGVMFTINPVTRDKKHMMIESSYGLGEMVVSGIVSPDNYIVARNPLEVVEFNIAIKEKMMVFQSGKNRTVNVPEEKSDKASLREEQVLELAKIGLGIEEHYGKPQDIEWAFAEGKFYITQARPITTL